MHIVSRCPILPGKTLLHNGKICRAVNFELAIMQFQCKLTADTPHVIAKCAVKELIIVNNCMDASLIIYFFCRQSHATESGQVSTEWKLWLSLETRVYVQGGL